MDNRYCFFCVGTGGHVLPAKNLIESLLNSGLSSKDIYIVTDLRGAKYFEDIDIDVITKSFYVSSKGILEYLKSTKQFISTLRELYFELRSIIIFKAFYYFNFHSTSQLKKYQVLQINS